MSPRRMSPRAVELAEALSALASPARIQILHEVRSPKALREIEVPPEPRSDGAGTAERSVSRQTVRHHLDKLLEVGVVTTRDAVREYGATVEYVVNHQALFALSEEFRALARLRPTAEPESPTVRAEENPRPLETQGPCLVLVKGLDEGRAFPLAAKEGREWVIGRKRGVDVLLDFDPFVSSENALVGWDGSAHFVQDLPGSANGTTHNFRAVESGERKPLRMGDLIGVGRCLLMYRE